MEDLNPIWFLKHPLDSEQKSYILLDKLNTHKKKLKKDQILNTINRVLLLIKDLNNFKQSGIISKESYNKLNLEEIDTLNYYKELLIDDTEYIMIHKVIDKSLDILYRYANIGMELLKDRGNVIKTFEILPHNGIIENPGFGFLIIRNMVTDEILPYFWSESKMGGEGISRIGISMKRIDMGEDLYFSLSYISIVHEMLKNNNYIETGKTPRVLICEIEENFNINSEVIKIAKEKFIDKLANENRNFI